MNYRYLVSAASDLPISMLNDEFNGGVSIASLEAQSNKIVLNCQIKKSSTFPFCSLMIPLADASKQGLDLSRFDRMKLTLEFKSTEPDTILVYLLNDEGRAGNIHGRANMHTLAPVTGIADYEMNLAGFNLPSWWIFAHPEATYAGLRFDNIKYLQISTGDNTLERLVNIGFIQMELTGKWIAAKDLYLVLVIFWLVFSVVHAIYNLNKLHQENKQARKREADLAQINKFLSIEKEKYESMAKHDALTGCLNRTGLRDVLTRVIDLYIRKNNISSLILLDIDHFKRINDLFGHAEGDAVLIELSRFIQKHIREDDYLVRWGGEEFAIICCNTSAKGAVGLAENLRALIAGHKLSSKTAITCSFGVAELNSSKVNDWFKRADVALYLAKANGRNGVVLANESHLSHNTPH
ncbi:GGDEF domain-containing protein [Cellvibrio fontiphilus]|uniref:diguanylate cyclase n=2 Tax=Cellvibrio fontiphilus TaxID=1815559 RepID=A0ABV7FGY9_9GAMM